MNSATSLVDESIDQQKIRSALKLSIAPQNCGIKTGSLIALQVTFDSKCLLQKKGPVVH